MGYRAPPVWRDQKRTDRSTPRHALDSWAAAVAAVVPKTQTEALAGAVPKVSAAPVAADTVERPAPGAPSGQKKPAMREPQVAEQAEPVTSAGLAGHRSENSSPPGPEDAESWEEWEGQMAEMEASQVIPAAD